MLSSSIQKHRSSLYPNLENAAVAAHMGRVQNTAACVWSQSSVYSARHVLVVIGALW